MKTSNTGKSKKGRKTQPVPVTDRDIMFFLLGAWVVLVLEKMLLL